MLGSIIEDLTNDHGGPIEEWLWWSRIRNFAGGAAKLGIEFHANI